MGKLKIGWASRDISTTKPVNLVGQFIYRMSQGVDDPIYATALAIDDGADSVIFLSIDTVMIEAGVIDRIRALAAARNPEIPVMKILASATHTHTAPQQSPDTTNDIFGAGHSGMHDFPHPGTQLASADEYREFLCVKAADAVVEAWNSRSYGGVSYGYGFAVVAHSRRVVYFDDLSLREGAEHDSTGGVDGHASMYGNTNDPQFSHYEAGSDHFINLLFTHNPMGKLTGIVVNIPCPSQNSENNYRISADYWSDVRKVLHEKFGAVPVLPQCAAAGDLSPRILHYKDAQARRFRLKYDAPAQQTKAQRELCARKDIAQRVGEAVEEVYSWASKEIFYDLPICHKTEEIRLAKRLISDEEYENELAEYKEVQKQRYTEQGTANEILEYNSKLRATLLRHEQILSRYQQQKQEPTVPMELHTLRIGNIAFASNRFELYMDYQHRMQARSPFEQTFIIQLSAQPMGGGSGSYLCTQRGYEGRGYSASRYCNQVSPEGGQQLVEATVKALNELYK